MSNYVDIPGGSGSSSGVSSVNAQTGAVLITAGTGINVTNPTSGTVQIASTGGAAVWGSITGTLSSQTDLNTALAGKEPITSYSTLTYGATVTPVGSAIAQWYNLTATANFSLAVPSGTPIDGGVVYINVLWSGGAWQAAFSNSILIPTGSTFSGTYTGTSGKLTTFALKYYGLRSAWGVQSIVGDY